jgi:hypothetical protein
VADLAGVPVPPREHLPVDGDPGTDARGDGEVHHIVGVPFGVEPLADDPGVGVVVEVHVFGLEQL